MENSPDEGFIMGPYVASLGTHSKIPYLRDCQHSRVQSYVHDGPHMHDASFQINQVCIIDHKGKDMKDLRAGELLMKYDRGFLRYISCGKGEILRMIYFALRDHNWDTMAGVIQQEELKVNEQSFEISYVWSSTELSFPFKWYVQISGSVDHTIIFSIKGEALAKIRKNRTGFCVLHPIKECAGQACQILDSNGDWKEAVFPQLISPQQPFLDVRAMRWTVESQGAALLSFEGDVFETEDQRNWTDDSYKTYCTPLSLPFPVALERGDQVHQKITLAFDPLKTEASIPTARTVVLSPAKKLAQRPRIGLGVSSSFYHLHPSELAQLKALHLDHLRADIKLADGRWKQDLRHYCSEAQNLGVDLLLALSFTPDHKNELIKLSKILNTMDFDGDWHLLLLHERYKTTPSDLIEQALRVRDATHQKLRLGVGTNAYFTEFNRETPDFSQADFVCYSVNPQVHAFDRASLTETCEAQKYTVESAKAIAKDLPIYVSPVTLKPRFNPNATGPTPQIDEHELPPEVDRRQPTLYAACWTLGSLRHLAQSETACITYFETVGWRGVMQGDRQVQMPMRFPAQRNMLFPIYHLLRQVMAERNSEWIPLESSDTLAIKGIMFKKGMEATLLIANLHEEAKEVTVELATSACDVGYYSQESVSSADSDPFKDAKASDLKRSSREHLHVTLGAGSLAKIQVVLK